MLCVKYAEAWQSRSALSMGFVPRGNGRASDEFLRLERVQVERGGCSARAVRIRSDFSKKEGVSGGVGLDVHEFGWVEKFSGAQKRTVEKYRYVLLAYICK